MEKKATGSLLTRNLGDLVKKEHFVLEEIEVRQIAGLPDEILVALGVRTVGARLRLRSVASQWIQRQVIFFLTKEI